MHEVVVRFKDLQDGMHVYNVGDTFPREGVTVSASRINDLSTAHNRRGIPLIRGIEEAPPKPKEDTGDVEQVLVPDSDAEAKEKPRKGRKK